MSTDKEKTEAGGGDSPVLFGPSNDPRLSGRIDALTGDSLESAIANLQAFSDDVFGDDEEENPFPDGIPAAPAAAPADPDDSAPVMADPEGEDGLDRILDTLSDEPAEQAAPEEDADVQASSAGPEEIRSLKDIAQMQEADSPAPPPQRSPIADVLAGSLAGSEEPGEADYLDPGFSDQTDDGADQAVAEGADYHPLGDADIFAGYDDDLSGAPESDPALPDEEPDPDFTEEDPDFPEEGFDPDFPDEEVSDREDGAQSDRSYALPEPSPYGDQDMMGGAYGYDEDEPEPPRDEAAEETAEDMLEDWPMPEDKDAGQAAQPIQEPAAPASWAEEDDAGETRSEGSDLDDLITGLAGGAEGAPPRAADEAEADAAHARDDRVPAFLRRDEAGRPLTGALSGAPTQGAPVPDESPEITGEDIPMSDPEHAPDEGDVMTEEAPAAPPERSGRKRMLAGVAALALLAAAGVGAYVMMPGMLGQPGVAEGPEPVLAPLPDMAQIASEEPDAPAPFEAAETEAPFEAAEAEAPADPMGAAAPQGELTPAPVEEPREPVPAEVSDLLAELSRETEAPAPSEPGVTAEELEAVEARLGEVEQARTEAEARASGLTEELTSLTDQITGLLQRDSDQAERLERMERLIRGQSAILAQFGQMEESLEQTQVVLLDVSARIGAVEGQNPADRDAVNRALSDVEERIQALTANMSILARMSIEGVDALRAPNASSGTVGVRTAPAAQDASGGTDTVFQSETGGFRISSDPAGRVPSDVEKDDFVEGYGYVLDVLPASDGQRLVIMENGSILIPSGD